MTEEALFEQAIQLPAGERAGFLDRECPDPALRARVEALLAADEQSHHPLDGSAENTSTLGNAGTTNTFRPAAATESEGTVIAGRYKLRQPIGEGGMGTVWMADQTEPVKRKVAVKLIRVERGQSKTILARFEAERQAIALMDHPHIARLLDAGTTESGSPFFVMELVKGIPLNEFCDQHKLTIADRLNLFMQICSAVQHAHQKGVIHRDLKPSNILVESHDGKPVPKVIDFGLAKATTGLQLTEQSMYTAFGSVMGTPLYMAPEQATFNAVDVDTRADVYALGVILYEMLTGTTPITRDTLKKAALDEMLKLIREEEAPTPSSRLSSAESMPGVAASRQIEPAKLGRFVKGELDWIVMKALSKERDRRYETANGFARDIERFLNHEPVQAGPPSASYRLKKFVQRNRMQVIAASLVLLALLAGIAGTTIGLVKANRAAEAERVALVEANLQSQKAQAAAAEERKAKQLAETEKANALKAAEAEKVAKLDAEAKREEAVRNLGFAKKGNELLGSVFAGLDPNKIAESGRPLQDLLRENLVTAVKELEGSAIGDPLEVAAMQNTLGNSLLGLGEAKLAIEVLEKVRNTYKAKLGLDHPLTLTAMNILALAYEYAGQFDKALPLLEETLKLRKAKLGPDHSDTFISMHNLADLYEATEQWDKHNALLEEMIKLKEELLKLRKSKLGPDHPETLDTMYDLAKDYEAMLQFHQAVQLFEETLKLRKAKLGPDHPATIQSMNILAKSYHYYSERDKALPLLEEILKLARAKFGPDHPNTLSCMNNLAMVYEDAGKLDQSLPLKEEILKLQKARLGPDHPETLLAMNALARGYSVTEQLDKALPLLQETLKLSKAKLGPDHPQTHVTMMALADGYNAADQPDKALPLYEETLKFQKTKIDPNNPPIEFSMIELFADLNRKLLDSKSKYQRTRETRGEKHIDTLLALHDIAELNIELYQMNLAESQLAEVLAGLTVLGPEDPIRELTVSLLQKCLNNRLGKPDTWTKFNTQSLLGGALLGQQKYTDAEPLLLKGYEGMKAREKTIPKVPQTATRIPEALDRLIELYTATNKPDELKKWEAERAKYPTPKEAAPMPSEKKK